MVQLGNIALSDKNALPLEMVTLIANLQARNAQLEAQVKELTQLVAELKEERNKNSRNSNKPPSSDALGERRKIRKARKPSGRKAGGQMGHKGSCRKLLPADQIDKIVNIYPGRCECCGCVPPHSCFTNFSRHQLVELAKNGGRHVTEYRLYKGKCTCGEMVLPPRDQIPRSAFGTRLKSLVASIVGNYHLSRRQVVLFLAETLGIKISLGSVSNIEAQITTSLEAPSEEALAHATIADVKHIDETSWVHQYKPCSTWVIATAAVSVFRIVANGGRAGLVNILQSKANGVLVSDRASVFLFWSMKKRQVCWSHLHRKFVCFAQRAGPIGKLGEDLIVCAELVFEYWRQYRSAVLSREQFHKYMEALSKATEYTLKKAISAAIKGVSGSCANILKHWDAMWTFVHNHGVEPSNNHAERELRRLVMWRKKCFGTRSERGQRFVERTLTVTHTLRKQGRRVLDFLHKSLEAMLCGKAAPSLVLMG